MLLGRRLGAAGALDHPAALRLVGADVACSAVYGAHTVLLLLLASRLGLGASGYGYLLAACGLGGVVGYGAGGTARLGAVSGTAPRSPAPAPGGRGGPTSLLLGAAAPSALLLLWAALVGAASLVVEVATDTSLQPIVGAEEVLGSVYGVGLPRGGGRHRLGFPARSAPGLGALGVTGALLAVGAAA